jgi:hypothetical protein
MSCPDDDSMLSTEFRHCLDGSLHVAVREVSEHAAGEHEVSGYRSYKGVSARCVSDDYLDAGESAAAEAECWKADGATEDGLLAAAFRAFGGRPIGLTL